MLDATGKIPDGLIGGNVNALGSYQGCLDIEANPTDSPPFSGKFGGATFYGMGPGAAFGMFLLYGICLPDTCTDQDFMDILYTVDFQVGELNHWIWVPSLSTRSKSYNLDRADILML